MVQNKFCLIWKANVFQKFIAPEAFITTFQPLWFFSSKCPVKYFTQNWHFLKPCFCDVISNRSFCYSFYTLMFFCSMGPVKYFWQKWQCQKTFFVRFQQQKLLLQLGKYFPQNWPFLKTWFVVFQQQKFLLQLLHPNVFSAV